jgi:hypothetical protein
VSLLDGLALPGANAAARVCFCHVRSWRNRPVGEANAAVNPPGIRQHCRRRNASAE